MSIECMDDLPEDALWLESSGQFERYQTGAEVNGDGVSTWFCGCCGAAVDDPADGCPTCDPELVSVFYEEEPEEARP